MSRVRTYTKQEEQANALSHGLGILLGLIGGWYLLTAAHASTDVWAVPSVFVYLVGMLSSYVSSTCYHALPTGKRKRVFQKIDHAAIYWHIAGTYTPLTMLILREEGLWGWMLLIFVWSVAIVGTVVSFRTSGKHSYIETICYVLMGCVVFVAFKPLIDVLRETDRMEVLFWIIAGGISYIVGALFYSLPKVRYMHTVFHLFVLGGTICHILAIYYAI